jgi:hypothetical protein
MIGLLPIKCQISGCQKFAHHVCSIEWGTKNNLPEGLIGTLCQDHHPQYTMSAASSSTTATTQTGSPTAIAVPPTLATGTPPLFPSPAAAIAAAAAQGLTMSVSSFQKERRQDCQ